MVRLYWHTTRSCHGGEAGRGPKHEALEAQEALETQLRRDERHPEADRGVVLPRLGQQGPVSVGWGRLATDNVLVDHALPLRHHRNRHQHHRVYEQPTTLDRPCSAPPLLEARQKTGFESSDLVCWG